MATEAELCGPIRSTFEALVTQRAVGHCHEDGRRCGLRAAH